MPPPRTGPADGGLHPDQMMPCGWGSLPKSRISAIKRWTKGAYAQLLATQATILDTAAGA